MDLLPIAGALGALFAMATLVWLHGQRRSWRSRFTEASTEALRHVTEIQGLRQRIREIELAVGAHPGKFTQRYLGGAYVELTIPLQGFELAGPASQSWRPLRFSSILFRTVEQVPLGTSALDGYENSGTLRRELHGEMLEQLYRSGLLQIVALDNRDGVRGTMPPVIRYQAVLDVMPPEANAPLRQEPDATVLVPSHPVPRETTTRVVGAIGQL